MQSIKRPRFCFPEQSVGVHRFCCWPGLSHLLLFWSYLTHESFFAQISTFRFNLFEAFSLLTSCLRLCLSQFSIPPRLTPQENTLKGRRHYFVTVLSSVCGWWTPWSPAWLETEPHGLQCIATPQCLPHSYYEGKKENTQAPQYLLQRHVPNNYLSSMRPHFLEVLAPPDIATSCGQALNA